MNLTTLSVFSGFSLINLESLDHEIDRIENNFDQDKTLSIHDISKIILKAIPSTEQEIKKISQMIASAPINTQEAIQDIFKYLSFLFSQVKTPETIKCQESLLDFDIAIQKLRTGIHQDAVANTNPLTNLYKKSIPFFNSTNAPTIVTIKPFAQMLKDIDLLPSTSREKLLYKLFGIVNSIDQHKFRYWVSSVAGSDKSIKNAVLEILTSLRRSLQDFLLSNEKETGPFYRFDRFLQSVANQIECNSFDFSHLPNDLQSMILSNMEAPSRKEMISTSKEIRFATVVEQLDKGDLSIKQIKDLICNEVFMSNFSDKIFNIAISRGKGTLDCDDDFSILSSFQNLKSLRLIGPFTDESLENLKKLPNLQRLDLSTASLISDITPLQHLIQLQSLDLSTASLISDITPLQSLTQLKSLNLSKCSSIYDITSLQYLTQLQNLNLCYTSIGDITPLQFLVQLQSLDLSRNYKIRDITPLRFLIQLQSLNLSKSSKISDIAPLQYLTRLQNLNLSQCCDIRDITHLKFLTCLQSLDLSGFFGIRDITPLQNLLQLRSLNLSGCENIKNIIPLQSLVDLRTLNLSGWKANTSWDGKRDITPLQFLTRLQNLNLSGCYDICYITPLKSLIQLQSLNLSKCYQIRDIAPLQNLLQLRNLDISDCDNIRDITPLKSLIELQIQS